MKAIIDDHAVVADEHIRRDLEKELSRGVEVVDGDVQPIGGEVLPREEVQVIEHEAVADAEEASIQSKTIPFAEVELVTLLRITLEGTLPKR